MSEEIYYTIPEAAERLRVTPQAIQKWIRQGKLKAVYVGSDRRVTASAIVAFVQASTKERESRGMDSGAKIEDEIQSPSHGAALTPA